MVNRPLWTKEFWAATAERAIGTAAQAAIGLFTGTILLEQVDWKFAVWTTLVAAFLSVLKSIVSVTVMGNPGPSFSPEVLKNDRE